MIGISKRAVVGAVAAALSLVGRTASAQWHATGVGVAEYDTKQTLLLLAGVSASPAGKGVVPDLGVQGYHLGYDNGPGRTNVFVVKPYAGLEDNYDGGQIGFNVGYSFVNKDVSGFVTSVPVDQGKGVVLAGNWDNWGTGNDPWGYQALAAYNFGSSDFWGRGRVTERISSTSNSQKRLGGEVAYLTGNGYSAWQPGAVLEFHNPGGGILGLGAGLKFFGNGGGNAVYFKVEGVLPLAR
jgi:hypothetical protein